MHCTCITNICTQLAVLLCELTTASHISYCLQAYFCTVVKGLNADDSCLDIRFLQTCCLNTPHKPSHILHKLLYNCPFELVIWIILLFTNPSKYKLTFLKSPLLVGLFISCIKHLCMFRILITFTVYQFKLAIIKGPIPNEMAFTFLDSIVFILISV